ncbi:hypothetical protein QBC37DRAFT_373914 [Rhypophila decipiens]|uniref:Integral membrane protein n=1 Tax=Rhypophila decipiens TaxID=261697 RepID=A0AAN6YCJ2_9PEZI|nr:hypothetical protein QBC37DRAFT_373914 [Rhypophila decipiens]
MAHIGGNNWRHCTITMIVWVLVSGMFVFARLATRYRLGPDRLSYDDWILLSAWIFAVIKGVLTTVSFFPMYQGWSVMGYYMSPDPDLHFRAEIIFGVALFFGALEEALVRSAVIAFLYRLAVNKWAAGCGIYKLYLVITWTPAQDGVIGSLVTFYERGIFMVCVSIPALLPLWSLYQEKRRRRRALGAGEPERRVLTVGGGGLKQDGALGDGVINDPRLEALLVDTVPTTGGQSMMSEKRSKLDLYTSGTRPEKKRIDSDTTDLVATGSSQLSSGPSTRP